MIRLAASALALLISCPGLSGCASSFGTPAPVSDDGQIQVAGFWLPFSNYASPDAARVFVDKLRHPDNVSLADIPTARAYYDAFNKRLLAKARALYAVRISHANIGGVGVNVVEPEAGMAPANVHRVLINLHGGAFLWGAGAGGQLEATPIAAIMGIKVLAVDYREGPENKFPAASEDVAAVYREVLKTYASSDVGIYGCSAGGVLTEEALAWFERNGLPRPGAAGVFCAGDSFSGDSSYLAPVLTGQPAVPKGGKGLSMAQLPYFTDSSESDPLVNPSRSTKVLGQFPPTLIISGTRDFAMSGAINLHRDLVKAGVSADLHIWDGMWHAFFMDAELPESREAYAVICKFFDDKLGR